MTCKTDDPFPVSKGVAHEVFIPDLLRESQIFWALFFQSQRNLQFLLIWSDHKMGFK